MQAWLLKGCQEATGSSKAAESRLLSCTAASRDLYNAHADLTGPMMDVASFGDSTAAAVPADELQQVTPCLDCLHSVQVQLCHVPGVDTITGLPDGIRRWWVVSTSTSILSAALSQIDLVSPADPPPCLCLVLLLHQSRMCREPQSHP